MDSSFPPPVKGIEPSRVFDVIQDGVDYPLRRILSLVAGQTGARYAWLSLSAEGKLAPVSAVGDGVEDVVTLDSTLSGRPMRDGRRVHLCPLDDDPVGAECPGAPSRSAPWRLPAIPC